MKIEIDMDGYFEGNFEDRVFISVSNIIASRLEERLMEEARNIIVKEISKSISSSVDNMIAARLAEPIPEVNTWGEKTGKVTTFAELVSKRWEEKLKASDSYNRTPLLQKLISDFALAGLQQEATAAMKSINEEARKQVHESIKDIVATQLTKSIKIS